MSFTKKKKKKGEGEFFGAEKEDKNVLYKEKKDNQKVVDASVLKANFASYVELK